MLKYTYPLIKNYYCPSSLYDEAYNYFIKKGYCFYTVYKKEIFCFKYCLIYIWTDGYFTIDGEDYSDGINLERIFKFKKLNDVQI